MAVPSQIPWRRPYALAILRRHRDTTSCRHVQWPLLKSPYQGAEEQSRGHMTCAYRALGEGNHMNNIQGPFYPRPIVPIGPSETNRAGPRRFKGKIVGVRPGRSGEVGTTQIITIKLSASPQEAGRLLHAEVEILMPHK